MAEHLKPQNINNLSRTTSESHLNRNLTRSESFHTVQKAVLRGQLHRPSEHGEPPAGAACRPSLPS